MAENEYENNNNNNRGNNGNSGIEDVTDFIYKHKIQDSIQYPLVYLKQCRWNSCYFR